MGEAALRGLEIDRVDWLDSGGRSGLLRVHGRWAAPGPLPELVIPTPDGEERHASLPDPRAQREPGTWRGAYVVRSEQVSAAGSGMQLEFATGVRVRIPAPAPARPAPVRRSPPPAEEEAEASGGEVVDRAVLAERRARRAEAAEQAQARIAREALRAVEILELRAAELEQRLESADAPAPDEELRSRLRELERRLAEAHERAAPAPVTVEEDDRRIERLRSALSSAIVTIGDLRLALHEARVRRRVADVERGADGVRLAVLAAERSTVDGELAALRARLGEAEAREAQLRGDAERAAARAAEAEAAHEEIGRRLEERSSELERARERVAVLEGELAEARAEAERVAGELPDAVRTAVERREEELRAAHAEAAALAGEELAGVRSQLERLEAEVVAAETARRLAEAASAAAAAERQAAEVAWATRAEELAAAAAPQPPDPPAPPPDAAEAPVDPAALAAKARALGPAVPEPGTGEHLVAGLDAAAAALRRSADTPPARPLRRVLVDFAREDPAAAAQVLLGLLPAQWRAVPAPLEYDLTIAGTGTFAVSVREKSAGVVAVRRPRRRAEFHLRADAVVLAEMLAGLRPAPGRLGRVRARGRRRRLEETLAALRDSRLSLEEALGAGASVDPVLALRLLGHAVDPAWTRGSGLRIAHTFTGSGRTLLLAASDGGGLRVSPDGGGDVDATVAISEEAFAARLRGEAPPERPTVRGDHQAVEQLREWAERARRGGA